MFTVKSVSSDGVYYLINHWGKYKTFFVDHVPYVTDQLFKTEADAKRSITKLLKGLRGEWYGEDEFTIINLTSRSCSDD